MAGTLGRAGFEVVVYNRTRSGAEDTAERVGGRVADTPREAAAAADIVISSLADDAALEAVYGGPDGVAAGLRAGTVAADTSTVDPQTIRDLLPLFEETGAALIDAPVSGSVSLVEAGNLTIMVGGEEPALELARPALEALSARVFHLGPLGAGATVKLAVNALVHAINTALSEALVLAEKAGVERQLVYEVFAAGAGGAPFVQYKKDAYLNPEQAAVAFSLDLVAKDLRLILGLAEHVGAEMPQGAANLALTDSAIAAGLGDHDMSAIAEYLRR
jgi:3-hydroxyisobutyrate dehydrogenase/2-hydroxy-3-oxopropionate reductase